MNDKTSVFMKTGRVKNDSWLFWSMRPNGLSWQQDRIWHHSLWIRMKEMKWFCWFENHHENSSSAQLLCSYWLKFLDLRKGVGSGKKENDVRLNGSSSWVGWFYGQHCTGLRSSARGPQDKRRCSFHVSRQEKQYIICTSHRPFSDMEY